MNTLNIDLLLAYIKQELPEGERIAIAEQIMQSEANQRELARARQILAGMQLKTQPSPSVLNRVMAAFKRNQKRAQTRGLFSADLQFDSWTQGVALGMRGTLQERQLLFTHGEFDIDLQIAQDNGSDMHILQGQLLGNEEDEEIVNGIELRLRHTDHYLDYVERRSLTDDLGRFRFSHIASGTYSLRVMLDQHDMVLNTLNITA